LSFENLTDEVELKILDAIDEIHSLGVSHRDIRRENILVGTNGNVWIIDFEFSSYFPDSGDGKREILLASERKQVETLLHDIKTRKDEKLYGYLQVEQK
jgi:serine/threonine protein kinase